MGPNVSKWVDNFRRTYGSGSPDYVASMLEAKKYLRKSLEDAVRRDEEEREGAVRRDEEGR